MGFLITMFFITFAHAGFEGKNDSVSLKIFNKINCAAGLECSRTKGGVFNVTSLMDNVASTTTSLTAAQCGSTIVSDSADVVTLPEASTVLGCKYTFVCGTADDFDVNPADATDVIGITGSITGVNTTTVLAPAAGDALRCTDIGAGFVLKAVGANLWAVLSTNGIITDVN